MSWKARSRLELWSEADINARAAEVAKIAAATKLVGVGRNDLLKDDIAAAHHDVARKVAEGSSVLLKNDNATLPFKAGTRVAVIGDMAATARYQGSGSSKVNATKEENILDEVKNAEGLVLAGYEQGYDRQGKADRVLVEDAVALAGKESVDVVLAVVGLDERSESEGLDRSTMAIPQVQNDLVEALKGAGKPIVVVLVAGSPVELPWIDDVAAVLYVGLSGQAGASATVRALTGEINPSGHLAEPGQCITRIARAPVGIRRLVAMRSIAKARSLATVITRPPVCPCASRSVTA